MVQDDVGPRETSSHGVTDEENSKMQVIWDQAMCKEMQIPSGYQNVAVLIIKWTEELDQVKSGSEVKQLKELFRQSFRYHTQVVELHNNTKPQKQLNGAVMDFVNKHDGPHNLSIVYYTGHASSHEANGLLELHAADTQADTPKGDYHASAFWNHAERPMIEDGEGDMVAIFDTCFASNLHKNIQPEDGRTYELLTASGHGRLTAGPGPKSFTAALMKSLNDLLEECRNKPFTIRQLCERINLQPTRLKNPSHVWSRLNRFDRNIALAPLTRTLAEREKEFDLDQSRALLFLRLSVTVDLLTEQQIKTIAQAFSKAVKSTKTPVKRIDWWRFQGLGPMRQIIRFADLVKVVGSAVKWKNIMLSSQQAQPSITTWDGNIQTMDDPLPHPTHDPNTLDSVLVESASEPTPPPHVSHKRKYSRGHHSTSSSPLKRAP